MVRKRAASRLHLLTVREVQTASEGDHADGGGLLLRVRGESSSWVFRYTAVDGRRPEMGLGAAHLGNAKLAGDSLTTARDLAHAARNDLARGVDPIDARVRLRDESRKAAEAAKADKAKARLTLARAARAYHERAIEPRLSARHGAQWITSLENHVPHDVWHRPIAEIDAPTLLAALSTVRSLEKPGAHVPETLQRIRQRLDAVFEDAIFHGLCTTNPAAAIRRKMRETVPRKKAGNFAALPHREAPAFMAQLRAAEGVAARCLEFAVLTCARTSEALTLEWRELDLEGRLWTVPAHKMKAREEHVVYLSERAVEIVEGMRGLDRTYVFPSTMVEGKPMSNMAMLAVLDRLGARDRTTVHGLCRATFSTWANDTAAARPEVVEACLAHRERDKVRAAYNRAKFNDERRALLEAWASFLSTPAATVIPLHAA
jgi:integrase